MQRRLAAILHADVASYSQLMAGDEEGTLNALKSRLEVLAEHIRGNGGRICNTAGDAILAEFCSVSSAIRCAADAQRQISDLNESVPKERRLAFRIGINLGEVIAEDDGQVYGTGVNVAARVEALAEPGGIAISGRAREQVDGSAAVRFVPMGEHRVKNIPKPVHIFRVVGREPDAGAKPLAFRWTSSKTKAVAALIGLFVLAAGALAVWRDELSAPRWAAETQDEGFTTRGNRIAVLPLHNASGDPQQTHFAEALTEDLMSALGSFAEIGVIARGAIAPYVQAAATPKDLRRELGATYLLAGSVRREGETVRLSIRLVDTGTELQLWSNLYERPIRQLFAAEDEIIRTVAGEVMVAVGRIEMERALAKATPDIEAYDLAARGRALVARETRQDNVAARQLFRKAIQRDAGYALAYVGLAWTHYREATRGWSEFMSQNIDQAEQLAWQALRLEPNLAEAYEVLGWVSLSRGNYEQAEEVLRKAVDLNPNDLGTLQALGNALTFLGDVDAAVLSMEKAVSLGARPSSRSIPVLALAYVLKDEPGKAIRVLDTYGRDRRDYFYFAAHAVAHTELGHVEEAHTAAKAARQAWPFFSVAEFADQFRRHEHRQRIADDLRRAGLN